MVTFVLDSHHRIGFLGAKEAILQVNLGPEGLRRLDGIALHVITHFDGSQSSWRPLKPSLGGSVPTEDAAAGNDERARAIKFQSIQLRMMCKAIY